MLYFIIGLCVGIAACILIISIGRKSGHNKNGIDDAIDRENGFKESLDSTRGELSRDIKSTRDRTSERFDNTREQIRSENKTTGDRISDTDGLVDDLKKRNGLE